MKTQSAAARISWAPIASLFGFALVALGMISFDWSAAPAQDADPTPKAKEAL